MHIKDPLLLTGEMAHKVNPANVLLVNQVVLNISIKNVMVECLLMVRWVIRSIPHGGPLELYCVPSSAPQLV